MAHKSPLISMYHLAALVLSALLFLAVPAIAADKVSLQLKWFHQFQFAGYYAAVEKGFYAEEGLEVEIRERDPKVTTIPIDAVLNGDAQFAIADTMLILERLQGSPVVTLAAVFQHSPLVLLSLNESGINSPLDLKGKRIMFTDDVALLATLAKFDIELTDIKRTPHNFRDDALLTFDVDAMSAYITSQPYFYKTKNREINVIAPADYGIDLYGDILFTSEDYIRNNPEQTLAFRRASLKGWRYALENSEEVIEWIKEKYHSKESHDFLRYEAQIIRQMVMAESVPLGNVNYERLKSIAEIYLQMELVPGPINLTGLHYSEYTDNPN